MHEAEKLSLEQIESFLNASQEIRFEGEIEHGSPISEEFTDGLARGHNINVDVISVKLRFQFDREQRKERKLLWKTWESSNEEPS